MQAEVDQGIIINMVLFTEGALLLVATAWMIIAHINLVPQLTVTALPLLLGCGAGAVIALLSVGLYKASTSGWLIFRFLAPMRRMIEQALAPLFAQITVADVLLLSLTSGFCEEILFRGILMQQFGLIPSSLLFGILHGPNLRQIQYGIWALAVGAFLGWLALYTHSLWAPIAAHIINNILGLLLLRHIARTLPQETKNS